jgi:hypothetical protein
MSEFILNEKKYRVANSLDINFKRMTAFNYYFRQITEDITESSFTLLRNKIVKAINDGFTYDIAKHLYDYELSLKISTPEHDAWGFCFALIVSEEGEDLSNIDELFLKSKIEKLSKDGLTFEQVKKEVENFTTAFPLKSAVYKMRAEGLLL